MSSESVIIAPYPGIVAKAPRIREVGANQRIGQTANSIRGRLLGFIRKRVASEDDAEDILQDVFYQFVASADIEEPIEQVASWLYTVAKNKITDWYRKKRPETFDPDDEANALGVLALIGDAQDTPEGSYEQKLMWEAISSALDELPTKQREVFIMHEIEGRPFKEIAEMTGENINTLLARKRYATLTLREKLQEVYDDFVS
jgi:RNA polymerase sigma factor (sigma-70 family)